MTSVEHVADGSAASFHARELPSDRRPRLWWFTPTRVAAVLGSTQDDSVIDRDACDRLGIDVVKRRSGGGLVIVGALHTAWLDVLVPRGHPCWDDDVARAAWWIGEVWGDVLGRHAALDDVGTIAVHREAMITSPLARRVCFAGRGPGEVFVGGAKAVGISQRRTRDWSRFQCALSLRWDAELYSSILGAPQVSALELENVGTTMNLDVARLADDLIEQFRSRLD